MEISDADEVEGDGGDVGGVVGAGDDLGDVAERDLVVVLDVGVLAVGRLQRAVADQEDLADLDHRVELVALFFEGSGANLARFVNLELKQSISLSI